MNVSVGGLASLSLWKQPCWSFGARNELAAGLAGNCNVLNCKNEREMQHVREDTFTHRACARPEEWHRPTHTCCCCSSIPGDTPQQQHQQREMYQLYHSNDVVSW